MIPRWRARENRATGPSSSPMCFRISPTSASSPFPTTWLPRAWTYGLALVASAARDRLGLAMDPAADGSALAAGVGARRRRGRDRRNRALGADQVAVLRRGRRGRTIPPCSGRAWPLRRRWWRSSRRSCSAAWSCSARCSGTRRARAGSKDPLGDALHDRSIRDVAPGAWTPAALAISTIAFAAGHAPGEWLAASAYGLLMAGLWIWRKDLLSCVVAHGVTNATLALWVLQSGQWTSGRVHYGGITACRH